MVLSLRVLGDQFGRYEDGEYVFKSCGIYIVVLQRLRDTKTNELRGNVFDKGHAKFRGNKFDVVAIINKYEYDEDQINIVDSNYTPSFKYTVGKTISEKRYNKNINDICASGIHYYLTWEAAYFYDIDLTLVKDGNIIDYNDNGSINEEYEVYGDTKHGQYKSYHTNNTLKSEGFMIHGAKYGSWKYYDKGGIMIAQKTYTNGVEHGEQMGFYSDNIVKVKFTRQNGKKHGKFIRYYENGNIVEEGYHLNDKMVGNWDYNDMNGTKIHTIDHSPGHNYDKLFKKLDPSDNLAIMDDKSNKEYDSDDNESDIIEIDTSAIKKNSRQLTAIKPTQQIMVKNTKKKPKPVKTVTYTNYVPHSNYISKPYKRQPKKKLYFDPYDGQYYYDYDDDYYNDDYYGGQIVLDNPHYGRY
jgi:antitoxin component YwqK of YwqJK toxin-antitoxin module